MKLFKWYGILFLMFQAGLISAQSKRIIGRVITADVGDIKELHSKVFRKCIGAGRANEGLRADWQEQLRLTKQECGFEYIRMHGLLSDDMGVYKENEKGIPSYNWQYIDRLYDFLLSINVRPFVELSFMPNDLASGTQTVFWWKGNITPPKSYDKWAALIKNLILHFTERYGENEVKKWYFEVWNEPNLKDLFWTGTQDEYFKLYEITARTIKDVNPSYRVGGPATAGSAWIPEMIDFCDNHSAPIDFISTHSYGVKQGFLDQFGTAGTILFNDKNCVSGEIIHTREIINKSKRPNLELHYTEWSSSYTPSDPIHDSYHEAAFILDKLKNTENATNSASYWVFTDIFEEAGPRFAPFHGGFGLLNHESIKKPAYYAFQFVNSLGDYEIRNSDPASWICKSKDNDSVQILFWDFSITHPGDSVLDQVYYKRDLPSKGKGETTVRLSNIPEGKYYLTIQRIGYRSNDAYMMYRDIGSPQQLTRGQVEAIKTANDGSPETNEIIIISSTKGFERRIMMRENDVVLIKLIKM